jgi:lipopolysaccharide export system permease protein
LQGVTFFELDENFQVTARIDAGSARHVDNEWQFRNIKQREFDPVNGAMINATTAKIEAIPFNKKPADFRQTNPHEWELNFLDLRKLAKRMQTEGHNATRYLVNMHSHIASPFACIVMVLLGIPFALHRGRNTSLAVGIVISVLVGVAYFMLHSVAMAFGYSGVLPPILATWSANILIGLSGLWLVLFRTQ